MRPVTVGLVIGCSASAHGSKDFAVYYDQVGTVFSTFDFNFCHAIIVTTEYIRCSFNCSSFIIFARILVI